MPLQGVSWWWRGQQEQRVIGLNRYSTINTLGGRCSTSWPAPLGALSPTSSPSQVVGPAGRQLDKLVSPLAKLSASGRVDAKSPTLVSNLHNFTNVEWLSTTVVVKPRQLIQRLSAFLVFLSTTFSGKTTPFIWTSRNKTTSFAMVLHINRRSATPENSRSAARASGCFDGWRHHARGLLQRFYPDSGNDKSQQRFCSWA